MNAPPITRPTIRHTCWHPASVVAASCLWMICSGSSPVRLAAASAAPVGWRSDSLGPADSWNTVTLEMSVKRQHLTKTGAAIGAPTPTATYRLERSNRTGSWKTVITVLSVDRSPSYALTGALQAPGAFPIARMEDDEDGTPVRAYDTRGRLVTPFSQSVGLAAVTSVASVASFTPPRSGGREWIETFIATAAGKPRRRQNLERRFGTGVPIGTLTRYARLEGDLLQEVIVDPRSVVPVEHNTSRAGKSTGHRTIAYSPAPNDAVVRTVVHSETPAASGADDRAVVDTTFSNIRLEQRR